MPAYNLLRCENDFGKNGLTDKHIAYSNLYNRYILRSKLHYFTISLWAFLFLFTKSDFFSPLYDANNFNHSGESEGREESFYFNRILLSL